MSEMITLTHEPISGNEVTLTLEQYEALLASKAKPTVVVDAAEYAELLALKAGGGKESANLNRVTGRMHELEAMLRREQAEHSAEIAMMTKRLEHK